MGKTIEGILLKNGHTIAGIIDLHNTQEITKSSADVAIEFSRPEAAFKNVTMCLENNIPVVCGTTGWLNEKEKLEEICQRHQGTFFYSSNFSVGVNIFFKVNAHLAKLMNAFTTYDVSIDEIHHTQKKDAPSGTAITLAEGILANLSRKTTWVNERATQAQELAIHSYREDPAPGTHLIRYKSIIDDIEIKHTAHSREGFAKGAVDVAAWIVKGKKKGILTMDDYLPF